MKSVNKLSIGQYNSPSWESIEKLIDGIYDREYYTNHGPLVIKLENQLKELCEVKNAICMTNVDIALMISLLALDLEGEVIIPAYSSVYIAQACKMLGLKVVYCDIEVDSPNIDINELKKCITKNTCCIIAVNNWGQSSDILALKYIADSNKLKLIFDSTDCFRQSYINKPKGGNGDLELFSFSEENLINGGEGACVTTNNNKLAVRIRNIRSSYGAGEKVNIPYTGNGRMSEIQAGLILISIDNMEANIEKNIKIFRMYNNYFKDSDNYRLFHPSSDNQELNYSRIVLVLDCNKSVKEIEQMIDHNIEIILSNYKFGVQPNGNNIEGMPNMKSLINNSLTLPFSRENQTYLIKAFSEDLISIINCEND